MAGHVRELEHAIEHACVRCQGDLIGLADLPRELQGGEGLDPETVARLDAGRQVVLDRPLLERLVRENQGNRAKTARMLGIGRTTLWRRLRAPAPATEPHASTLRSSDREAG